MCFFLQLLWSRISVSIRSFRPQMGATDRLSGGIGYRKGRPPGNALAEGDCIDFWQALYASREDRRLLLFAEMSLPGEGWLEFRIDSDGLPHQTATFRPRGLWGRFYWLLISPFHWFIFRGPIRQLAAN